MADGMLCPGGKAERNSQITDDVAGSGLVSLDVTGQLHQLL